MSSVFTALCLLICLLSSSASHEILRVSLIGSPSNVVLPTLGKGFVDIVSNASLLFGCRGSRMLTNTFPPVPGMFKDANNIVESASDEWGNYFQVEHMKYHQTGRYSCLFDSNEAASPLNSLFVFVNDINELFVPVLQPWLYLQQPQDIMCISTYSTVNVSLWVKEDTGYERYPQVVYEPTRGFHFSNFTLRRPFVQCRASINGKTGKPKKMTLYIRKPPSQLKPWIEPSLNFVLINSTFRLNCSVIIRLAMPVNITWGHRAEANRSPPVYSIPLPDNRHLRVSTLTVTEAKPGDEGTYICKASVFDKENSTSIEVKLTDAKDGLSVDSSVEHPVIGENLTLTCRANLVESEPNLDWFWKPFGNTSWKQLTDGENVTIEFNKTEYSYQSKLSLNPLTIGRKRDYRCNASVVNGPPDKRTAKSRSYRLSMAKLPPPMTIRELVDDDSLLLLAVSLIIATITFTTIIFILTTSIHWLQRYLYPYYIPLNFVTPTVSIAGEGAFGRVVVGTYRRRKAEERVAVKMIKETTDEQKKEEQIKVLKNELNHLVTLHKDGGHENIVALKGAVTSKSHFFVVLQFCEMKGLLDFLRLFKDNVPDFFYNPEANGFEMPLRIGAAMPLVIGHDIKALPYYQMNILLQTQAKAVISVFNLLDYALQIARGMDFIGSKGIIHRDLGLKNILLTEDNVAKISDFGLSRECDESGHYWGDANDWHNTDLFCPDGFDYSSKSDVWMYGNLLWEIFSLGEPFFDGYQNNQPQRCPDHVFAIMTQCWAVNPNERPTFAQIIELLQPQ